MLGHGDMLPRQAKNSGTVTMPLSITCLGSLSPRSSKAIIHVTCASDITCMSAEEKLWRSAARVPGVGFEGAECLAGPESLSVFLSAAKPPSKQ